ncbi:MAG: RimK family alpha-L-glutamate ligase [Maricaulis sp.]|nr:RimK family alpha-L-glutamate ligase [Maricaulis sp.]HAQ35998.1 RimK family alpha-L-glutamate ligase [Alphaproteobacteria bacterium]
MSDWLILVEAAGDLAQHETPHKVMRLRDYIANPKLFTARRPNVVNLARSYGYQSEGYYASLLAEARGHRVMPTVQSITELSRKTLYAQALPELNAALVKDLDGQRPDASTLVFALGRSGHPPLTKFAKLLFDWFRVPVLEVTLSATKLEIDRIRPLSVQSLKGEARTFFQDSLAAYTKRNWVAPKEKTQARWSLAVLLDPEEKLPPSSQASMKRLASVAARMGVEVEPIGPGDLASLAEFDALFIRATTAIDNFTYRFARRAEQEGMPVIDDTVSMLRCTNKVYLKELLEGAGVPGPRTEVLAENAPLDGLLDRLGTPVVLKAPDGSFSRSVFKVSSEAELKDRAKQLFQDTALIIAQEYMPTTYDWRVGVLGGKALFACKYKMARGHWQIIKHGEGGRITEGGFETLPVEDAPQDVIDTALKAARLIGDGFYGIDLKQNDQGVFVIEINDNPNLDTDVEGAVLKDRLWSALIDWFSARLEARIGAPVSRKGRNTSLSG